MEQRIKGMNSGNVLRQFTNFNETTQIIIENLNTLFFICLTHKTYNI